ncbi:disulfide-bond oxidoreductase [Acrasis kona]|uniref:Disulfide-bond oxidoreductase n=1 Tax=Acrasis kona TaxID=1008807 RepID=A0AAW2Z6Y4_9EUKA
MLSRIIKSNKILFTKNIRTMSSKPIDLYTLPFYNGGPNGIKASIALEELGLEYKTHSIDISKNEQFAPEFLKISPNNKIPAIVDHDGPGGKELPLFESGAILVYLAEKTGKLLSQDPVEKYQILQWVFWQVGGLGPMVGQANHFVVYAKEDVPYAKKRYTEEASRLFGVLDKQIGDKNFIVGNELTIADIASFGWAHMTFLNPKYQEYFKKADYPNVQRWLNTLNERPAFKKAQPNEYFKN